MATLTAQPATRAGATLTFVAASGGGDACPTGSGVALLVTNGDSASHTVTLVTPGTQFGLAIDDRTVTVAAGATALVLVDDEYRNPTTGLASITYPGGVTSVTVAAVRVG